MRFACIWLLLVVSSGCGGDDDKNFGPNWQATNNPCNDFFALIPDKIDLLIEEIERGDLDDAVAVEQLALDHRSQSYIVENIIRNPQFRGTGVPGQRTTKGAIIMDLQEFIDGTLEGIAKEIDKGKRCVEGVASFEQFHVTLLSVRTRSVLVLRSDICS